MKDTILSKLHFLPERPEELTSKYLPMRGEWLLMREGKVVAILDTSVSSITSYDMGEYDRGKSKSHK